MKAKRPSMTTLALAAKSHEEAAALIRAAYPDASDFEIRRAILIAAEVRRAVGDTKA